MNLPILQSEVKTMSSNDDFLDDLSLPFYERFGGEKLEKLNQALLNGEASFLRASELSMSMMGLVMDKFTKAKAIYEQPLIDATYNNLSMKEKRQLMQDYIKELKWCGDYLEACKGLLQKYPNCTLVLDGGINLFRDSEILAYMDSHNTILKNKNPSEVKTYFFKNPTNSLIKIGKSNNVEKRKKIIEIGTGAELEVLCVLDENIEGKLHRKFKQYRIHGEWFDDKDGLIQQFIDEQLTSEGVV